MKIPADAIIPVGKLVEYLLAPRPKNDKSRFLLRAGFGQSNPEALDAAIRRATAARVRDAIGGILLPPRRYWRERVGVRVSTRGSCRTGRSGHLIDRLARNDRMP